MYRRSTPTQPKPKSKNKKARAPRGMSVYTTEPPPRSFQVSSYIPNLP